MLRIFILSLLLVSFAVGLACSGTTTAVVSGNDTPTEAYKRLYQTVKSKDIEAIKKNLTKKSIEFGQMAAQRNNTPPEQMYANGFTATTFADTLPEIRDQRVNGDMGAVEVWNSKESKWEDLPFILEEGVWKLAVGDLFAGTFKSPGRSQDSLEKEATNSATAATNVVRPGPAANANISVVTAEVMPDPASEKKGAKPESKKK